MKTIRVRPLAVSVLTVMVLILAASLANAEPVWIDVRSAEEYAGDHIDGAKNIPHTVIGEQIEKLELTKDTEINLYCRSGGRAGLAMKTLEDLGYTNVRNVGGLEDAKKVVAAAK